VTHEKYQYTHTHTHTHTHPRARVHTYYIIYIIFYSPRELCWIIIMTRSCLTNAAENGISRGTIMLGHNKVVQDGSKYHIIGTHNWNWQTVLLLGYGAFGESPPLVDCLWCIVFTYMSSIPIIIKIIKVY